MYSNAGLYISESLYKNISECLGYWFPCAGLVGGDVVDIRVARGLRLILAGRRKGGNDVASKRIGVLSSAWFEYVSFEKVERVPFEPNIEVRSLYGLMNSIVLGMSMTKLAKFKAKFKKKVEKLITHLRRWSVILAVILTSLSILLAFSSIVLFSVNGDAPLPPLLGFVAYLLLGFSILLFKFAGAKGF